MNTTNPDKGMFYDHMYSAYSLNSLNQNQLFRA